MSLKICTYNCCSLNKNIEMVRELTTERYDLILLQETFLTENRLGDLSFIDENYEVIGAPAIYSQKALESCAGRCEGGLACLWYREAPFIINSIEITKDYIVLSITHNNNVIVIVNVYVRSDICEARTLDDYLNTLSKLHNIIIDKSFDSIYFIRDFIADPSSGRAWQNLYNFSTSNNLECFDFNMLEESTFTFLSYGTGSTRWLDHVIGRNGNYSHICNMKVLYGMVGSDHFPLVFEMINRNQCLPKDGYNSKPNSNNSPYINWDKLSIDDIRNIEEKTLTEVKQCQNNGVMDCCTVGCRNKEHIKQLENEFCSFVEAFKSASSNYARMMKKQCKFKVIPGWNRHAKEAHRKAREDFLKWVTGGRIRGSQKFLAMRESGKKFKEKLNYCKRNEKQERSVSIQEKFANKDMKAFWGEVHQRNNKVKHSSIIDGKTDLKDIIQIFNNKFLKFEKDDSVENDEKHLLKRLCVYWNNNRKQCLKISVVSLKRLIRKLSVGTGHDDIHSNFLRQASDIFLSYLAKLMMSCYMHCYLPIDLLNGNVNPSIKDLNENTTISPNFRPTMQSSNLLKLFELHLSGFLEEKLRISMRHFLF